MRNLKLLYDHQRAQLERLQAAPERDEMAISSLIDELEHLQLQIKDEAGLHGNNPNE
jgi:hypothetical protein